MKTTILTVAAILLGASAAVTAAWAEGPRAASESTWRGMARPDAAAPANPAAAPRYAWQEGYDHGGKWRGRWVIVQ